MDEGVTARTSLRLGLMVGDVFVTAHAARTVCPSLGLMDRVTGDAFAVAGIERVVRDPV